MFLKTAELLQKETETASKVGLKGMANMIL